MLALKTSAYVFIMEMLARNGAKTQGSLSGVLISMTSFGLFACFVINAKLLSFQDKLLQAKEAFFGFAFCFHFL